MLPLPLPPEQAVSLPSSKQWDSKHGLYCVPRLTQFDTDFVYEGVATTDKGFGTYETGESPTLTTGIASAGIPLAMPYRGESLFSASPVPDPANPHL